ncbi:MAG: methyltransferase domain-containing protein [Acidobacteriota bacterium]|jgi:ubiquinone/menaquinone biosynthesis C-methylase UbiE
MDGRLQKRVQRYGWDKAASSYERFWADQLQPAQTCLLEMAELQPGEKVLDIACGTGLVTFPAAEAVGETGEVLATDLSQGMVDLLAEQIRQKGLPQVSAVRMEAENLDLEAESFDAALCALGLMYVPSPVVALQEMKRVLRPGGRVVSAVWGARNRCGWAEIFPIVDARVKSEVCPMFFQLGTGEGMRLHFEAAAFDDVASVRINTVLEYETPEDALSAAFEAGPVAMAYSRFDASTREEVHAEYLASIEPYRNHSGFEIPGEFVVTTGRKGGA